MVATNRISDLRFWLWAFLIAASFVLVREAAVHMPIVEYLGPHRFERAPAPIELKHRLRTGFSFVIPAWLIVLAALSYGGWRSLVKLLVSIVLLLLINAVILWPLLQGGE